MNYQFIEVKIEGSLAYLTLNRPEKHNALCIDMVQEIYHFLDSLIQNDTINALFILGNEKAFSAGGDLKEMQVLSKEAAEKRSQYVQSTLRILQALSFPVVAWVRGICLGGGLEMVLHCDFCICADTTQFGLPEVKYGMIPGAGGVTLLQHHMSKSDAMYYLSTGENIPLQKAYDSGLIQQIVAKDDFFDLLQSKAKYFASVNGFSLKAIKKIVTMNNKLDLDAVYRKESDEFSSLLFENGRKGIDKNFKK